MFSLIMYILYVIGVIFHLSNSIFSCHESAILFTVLKHLKAKPISSTLAHNDYTIRAQYYFSTFYCD